MKSKRPAIKWKIIRDFLSEHKTVDNSQLTFAMTKQQARENLNAMLAHGQLKVVKPHKLGLNGYSATFALV